MEEDAVVGADVGNMTPSILYAVENETYDSL